MANGPKEKPTEPDGFENREEILLGVLSAVDNDAQISQRTISRELDVALGLANAYLKRCVRKGWIKIKQVPPRRYAYFLTPQGFAEKSRLTGRYFSASFNFFRHAREQMSELMAQCASRGWKRIALAGASELAEVGTLCAHDHPVQIVAIVDADYVDDRFCGLPVKKTLADCETLDVVIVTSLSAPQATFQKMKTDFDPDRVLAPRLMRLALPVATVPGASHEAAE